MLLVGTHGTLPTNGKPHGRAHIYAPDTWQAVANILIQPGIYTNARPKIQHDITYMTVC